MHETQRKVAQLKQVSMVKFEATARLRQMQERRTQLLQRRNLYKEQLRDCSMRSEALRTFCERFKVASAAFAERLEIRQNNRSREQSCLLMAEQSVEAQTNALMIEREKLRKRQSKMVSAVQDSP